jgi:Na+/serine symporter
MNTDSIKSKIIKAIWLLPLLIILCLLSGILFVSLMFVLSRLMQIGHDYFIFKMSAYITVTIFYLLALVSLFLFVRKKSKKQAFIFRIFVYFLFITFSAALLFPVFYCFFPFEHFLRASRQRSYYSMLPSFFYAAIASTVGYIILLLMMELKKQINNILKPLIYWFLMILLGWYLSIPLLFLYTGLDYQKKCIWSNWANPSLASEYCYIIGESVHRQWQIVPAVIMFIFEIMLVILYFKYNKEKEK